MIVASKGIDQKNLGISDDKIVLSKKDRGRVLTDITDIIIVFRLR